MDKQTEIMLLTGLSSLSAAVAVLVGGSPALTKDASMELTSALLESSENLTEVARLLSGEKQKYQQVIVRVTPYTRQTADREIRAYRADTCITIAEKGGLVVDEGGFTYYTADSESEEAAISELKASLLNINVNDSQEIISKPLQKLVPDGYSINIELKRFNG